MTRTRTFVDWFLRDPTTGRLTVAKPPNPALVAWALARTGSLAWDERENELRCIASGALIVWAFDELVRGNSPFRRVLGGGVLAHQVWRLST
jgi:hypothetical protein